MSIFQRNLTRFIYAIPEIGSNGVEIFLRLHLLVFYSTDQKMRPADVGLALAIALFWDALMDPWIGKFSDEFRRRRGSRMALVLLGAAISAISLAILFNPPAGLSDTQKWWFLLSMSLVLNTSYTLFSIPYSAMVGDYTQDRNERSLLIGWRLAFANLGAVLGIAIPGYYLSQSSLTAYSQSSWLMAILVLASSFLLSLRPPPLLKISEAESTTVKASPSVFLKNKPFLVLLGAYYVLNIGITINSSVAMFYYRLRLKITESEIQNVLLLFFVFFCVGIPLWMLIAKKLGRKMALLLGALSIGLTNPFIYPLLPEGDAMWAYLFASALGGILVGSSVLLESSLTDAVDFFRARFKQELFGLFFGLWKFTQKASRASAVFLAGFLLDWANVNFPDVDTGDRLALIFGLGTGAFFLLAAGFVFPFKLTEKKCLQIKRILQKQDKSSLRQA